MTLAERAYKITSIPLTYYKGVWENTTKLQHLPGFHEAGCDSTQAIAATWRDTIRYGVQFAEAARRQYAATRTASPPGFTRQLTATQQHEQNLQWWIDKREECRQNWLDKREKERAQTNASRGSTADFLSGRHPLGGVPSQESTCVQPCRTLRQRLLLLKRPPRRNMKREAARWRQQKYVRNTPPHANVRPFCLFWYPHGQFGGLVYDSHFRRLHVSLQGVCLGTA